jgi:hypothetical protein
MTPVAHPHFGPATIHPVSLHRPDEKMPWAEAPPVRVLRLASQGWPPLAFHSSSSRVFRTETYEV